MSKNESITASYNGREMSYGGYITIAHFSAPSSKPNIKWTNQRWRFSILSGILAKLIEISMWLLQKQQLLHLVPVPGGEVRWWHEHARQQWATRSLQHDSHQLQHDRIYRRKFKDLLLPHASNSILISASASESRVCYYWSRGNWIPVLFTAYLTSDYRNPKKHNYSNIWCLRPIYYI